MSKKIYSLRISCSSSEQKSKVSELLHLEPIRDINPDWCIEIEEREKYFDFINYFLDTMEGKYEELKAIGINKEHISIWFLYEYDNQCNLEFLPKDLKRIGENDITLCVSCWSSR